MSVNKTTTSTAQAQSKAVAPAETFVTTEHTIEKQSLKQLRDAIPDHCFRPSVIKTLGFITRDLCLVATIFSVGWYGIQNVPYAPLRWLLWPAYGFVQGLVFTGLWQIGHEMGHGSLLPSPWACNFFGFVLHCGLLTPYFAWRATHHKHHRYNVHMEKDNNHIPARVDEEDSFTIQLLEDAPAVVLLRCIILQVIGWPAHLAFTVSGGPTSCDYRHKDGATWMPDWLRKSQYNPIGSNFRPEETLSVIMSDIGIATTSTLVYKFAGVHGWGLTWLLIVQPWMWLNSWIIVVTYLHHTHPDMPKYEADSWTYMKSAMATIDRDFWFIGTFFFHNVVPYHVVHHLDTRIPFYHAKEATEAIMPILGKSYRRESSNYFMAYWNTYANCVWVASDKAEKPEDRALWFVDRDGVRLSDKADKSCKGAPQKERRGSMSKLKGKKVEQQMSMATYLLKLVGV